VEEPQVARNGEAEKEIKMRGRQRNSLTMWKRQILVGKAARQPRRALLLLTRIKDIRRSQR